MTPLAMPWKRVPFTYYRNDHLGEGKNYFIFLMQRMMQPSGSTITEHRFFLGITLEKCDKESICLMLHVLTVVRIVFDQCWISNMGCSLSMAGKTRGRDQEFNVYY